MHLGILADFHPLGAETWRTRPTRKPCISSHFMMRPKPRIERGMGGQSPPARRCTRTFTRRCPINVFCIKLLGENGHLLGEIIIGVGFTEAETIINVPAFLSDDTVKGSDDIGKG